MSIFSGVGDSGFPIEDSLWFKLLWTLFLVSGMTFGISTCQPWKLNFFHVGAFVKILNVICILISLAGIAVVFSNVLPKDLARDCVTFGALNLLACCYLNGQRGIKDVRT